MFSFISIFASGIFNEEALWQIIDDDLENQSAVTIWRPLKQWPLEHAWNNTATMVELKPKTGRYHQLRRHMVSARNKTLFQDNAIHHLLRLMPLKS